VPRKIDGIPYYTKAEIDQLVLGYVSALSFRNVLSYTIAADEWTQQSGGDLDGWWYADVDHGRNASAFAYVSAYKRESATIQICDGSNDVQEWQDTSTVRIWLRDAQYQDLLCLVVYG